MEKVMIDFSYKVRGDFSPNGLQKVFCSFHPSDKRQMEKIAEDILSVADCAVYYHTDQLSASEIDLEDYGLKLKEMKLFVIIVTTNYLSSDSLAKNWEYGFAVDHHIPVLPIAVESNLEEFFSSEMNRLGNGYGDVQLLKSRTTDNTELSYKEKLLRDLGTVLVENKEIERIKQAFAAQLFLSYRKKDRKYANELMRAIHSVPSLQNVSVWYDEFISSGEKWSDQIKEALINSDVFLLLITPFITEPDNYVIKEEYPAAQKQGKHVVAARKTDPQLNTPGIEELERAFPGLKVFVDGDNIDELEKALQELADRGESCAEKDYLIGLAFLNGIGVERDSEKAAALIVASARNGMPEAVNKLADMYWTGDGVSVNYEQAVNLRKKLVDIYECALENTNSLEIMVQYIEALEKLTDCLCDLSAFRESLYYGKKLERLLEETSFSVFDICAHYQARAYDLCGAICRRLGMYDDAISYARKYGELAGIQYESEATVTNLHNLAVSYERIGYTYYATGDLEQAKEWYQKALEIDMEIDGELQSIDSASSLSTKNLFLGDIYLRSREYGQADQYYMQAVTLRKRILEADSSDEYQRLYGESLLSLGTSAMLRGDVQRAKDLFDEAHKVNRNLAETYGTIESQHIYSVTLNRCAEVCVTEQNFEGALAYYFDSLNRRHQILSRNRTAETVFEYALVLYFIAETYKHSFNQTDAKKYYGEVVENLRPILGKDRKGDCHRVFAEAAFEWFVLDSFAGKCYLQYAIDAWKWLTDRWTENEDYRNQYERCRKIYRRCYPK